MKIWLKRTILVIVSILFYSGCGTPAIIEAIQTGDIEKVKKEVENGADVNTDDNFYGTALGKAASDGNFEIVKYLVERGADINKKSLGGSIALTRAFGGNKLEIIKYLVERKANINHVNKDGKTLIFWLALDCNIEGVKYLVENGAKINIQDNDEDTLLHFIGFKYSRRSIYHNELKDCQEMFEYLLSKGLDTTIKNKKGQTYLDMASPEARSKFIAIQQEIVNKKNQEIQNKKIGQINELITKQDYEGLKTLTEQNPNYVNYISDTELRLMLTGPKGMKVGDIKKLLVNGKSEAIIIPLIKRVQVPYKEFTIEEIDILSKMGLSDKIIGAMIDTTTELLKDEKKKKEQEFYLAEQKRIAEQKSQPQVIYQTVNNGNNNNQENDLANKVQDKLIEKGTEMLFKKLFR